ncbi:MAG: hypothetical protein IKE75_02875 [Bacilli bacterium]|nr:hypothetical protein [Bacilli bacterium]
MEKIVSEKNILLKQEFNNAVYDAIGEGILKTAKNHSYKKYDIAKLIMALYDKDFSYITSSDDYREQIKLLDEYFTKTYDHRLITFEMVKALKALQGTEEYVNLTEDVANIESIIRHNKNVPAENTEIFKGPLDDEEYDELMTKIENEESLRYGVAVIYDKLKNKTVNFNE